MAKQRKKTVNPWDLPQDKIQEVSSEIVQNTTGGSVDNSKVQETPKPKAKKTVTRRKTKTPTKSSAENEDFAVIRVGKSFHKKAKIAALVNDMKLGEYMEYLIEKHA